MCPSSSAHISQLVCARATRRVSRRLRWRASSRLDEHEPLGVVVRHLDQIGAAVAVELLDGVEHARRPDVVVAEGVLDRAQVGSRDEVERYAVGQPRIAGREQLVERPAVVVRP